MSSNISFDTVCPNGHNVAIDFTRPEFEDGLKSDTLEIHCNTCDTDWTPTAEEIAKLREVFPQSSS